MRKDEKTHGGVYAGDDGDECDQSGSLLLNSSSSLLDVENASKKQHFYSCVICGKVYIYLVSFRKHLQSHEDPQPPAKKLAPELSKYECAECGMGFIRKARLRAHMRVHRSRSEPPKCDLCNKCFTSVKSWIAHNHFHEQKPFWCLSCAKGFSDDKALDKHLLRHSEKPHVCTICQKSFQSLSHLKKHSKTHAETKRYQCKLCGKGFSFIGNLISHRKKHRKCFAGYSARPSGIRNSALLAKRRGVKRTRLCNLEEVPEMDTNKDEPLGKEDCTDIGEPPCEEFEDHADSEDSDCGEPMHCLRPSQPPGWVGSVPPDESNSESVEQQGGQGARMHREHKYWEWECCECDMGFDEVAMLHLHYIKHATGELPIPQAVYEN